MKVVEIGSCGDYEDIKFSPSRNPNKFGSLFYFKDRIYLVQNKATTNYALWSNEKSEAFLTLENETELVTELQSISMALSKQDTTLVFKELQPADRLYFKHGRDCGEIASNCELTYCICVYGFFKKPDGTMSFLQTEVAEHETKRISLLGKRHAVKEEDEVVPSKVQGLMSGSINYTPNSRAFEFNDDLY